MGRGLGDKEDEEEMAATTALPIMSFCVCVPKSTSRRDLWFLADGDGEEIDVSAFEAELNEQMVPNMGKRIIVFCIGQQGSDDGSQDVIQPVPNRY